MVDFLIELLRDLESHHPPPIFEKIKIGGG